MSTIVRALSNIYLLTSGKPSFHLLSEDACRCEPADELSTCCTQFIHTALINGQCSDNLAVSLVGGERPSTPGSKSFEVISRKAIGVTPPSLRANRPLVS